MYFITQTELFNRDALRHCLRLVLEIESFLAMAKFKQACFAHDLSKKFQIFAAVHNHLILVRSKGNDSDFKP